LIDQALRGCGHRVLMTADPLEALELGQRVRIDVLVDDVKPSGERPSLVERLRSLQPELRLVRVLDPEDHFPEPDGGVLLRRPFSLDELQSAIAQALKSEPSME
jgi:DNA-binding NtrC family response regulator